MSYFAQSQGLSKTPVILQSEAAECGLACLAMVAGAHGYETDLNALRRRFAISMKGVTLKTVLQMGERMGLTGRGLRLEPQHLGQLRLPAILHWDMNHFVVLTAVRGSKAIVHDPAVGRRVFTQEDLSRHFTGVALELTPAADFRPVRERLPLSLRQLIGRVDGLWGALGQALLLSLVLQLLVLAMPFYMQLAIDEAAMKGDGGLLGALAFGFVCLALFRFGVDWLRAQVLLHLAGVLNFQMAANLFRHMLRLPLEWFEKRHVGDLISRFGSTLPIRNLIAEGAVAAGADGLMAVLTLAMLFAYSPLLAGIVLLGVLIQLALRLGSFGILRAREEEAIVAYAKEQSVFIETARAIQSVKVFGAERDRSSLWQNRYARLIGRRAKLGRLQATLRAGGELVTGVELVIVIFIAARMAMNGAMTVGMIFAFIAWRQQFVDKAVKLLETAIQYRMLDLHLDRISDIALAAPDADASNEAGLAPQEVRGGLELRGVSYRYAETEPDVLTRVNLKVEPGEFLAITGPSGEGKTTLLKIMLGLFRPHEGEVLVDGRPLGAMGAAEFRSQVGVVMQEDLLLSGSIAENIAFFEPRMDLGRVRECASTAGIDDDIMAMPMNYNTLAGDMGAALSGGQRQRVLLARALYRQPKILFMDEGTSHLDVDKEREVNAALAGLSITRVVIAHRPETIAAADRIVVLKGGKIASEGELRAQGSPHSSDELSE